MNISIKIGLLASIDEYIHHNKKFKALSHPKIQSATLSSLTICLGAYDASPNPNLYLIVSTTIRPC